MPETYEEYRATYKGPSGNTSSPGPTRNPREAGEVYRRYRDQGAGGEAAIEKRTVTIGDWESVETTRVPPAGS